MKKIEVKMLLYTLAKKKIIEIEGNILNAFGIILFYKVVWWFDGQNINVDPRRPFNPIPLINIYYVEYVYSYIYIVHVCNCIIFR
jgi:hypothetical protein